MNPTTLTMANGKGITLALLLVLAGCCEKPVPTSDLPTHPCTPYCFPKAAK
jgi:hypothetical protein